MKRSSHEEPTPQNVWKFFAAFGIMFLLVFAYYGYQRYQMQQVTEQDMYNGFTFEKKEGGIWQVTIEVGIQPYYIPFYYHPRDTEEIPVDKTATDPILKGGPKVVYLSFDPDAGSQPVVAGVEISRITGSKYNLLNIETHGVLSRPSSDADIPVVTCDNASADVVVLQFLQGPQNAIVRYHKNPSCIILQYENASESIRVADRYVYMLLKIV